MRSEGVEGVRRGSRVRTTMVDEAAPRPPDLVNRHFTADRPDQLWLADITYVRTWEGWVYVAFVLDAFSRRIVGWQLADHLRTDLPLDALEMAMRQRQRDRPPGAERT
jgi:putative transposase